MRKIREIGRQIVAFLTYQLAPYRTEVTLDFPDEPDPRRIYLMGDNSSYWFAGLLCPCGCGSFIQLSLLDHDEPQWYVKKHLTGTVTMKPSVFRTTGCGSHFFIERNRIVWGFEWQL